MTGHSALANAFAAGLRPPPALSVGEWAEAFRKLSTRGSSEPGRYRLSRTPFWREVMECLSPASPVHTVAVMKCAQIGASEVGINWIGHTIHLNPAPMLAVYPTDGLASRFSRQRIAPMIEATPDLRRVLGTSRSRDAANSRLHKDFPGGSLVLTNASSPAGLSSMPARFLLEDECDRWVATIAGEGDPEALAEGRTDTFTIRRKIYKISTPTEDGRSRIHAAYMKGDRRLFFVPCPLCQHEQALVFGRLRWPDGDPDRARYECESCNGLFAESHKPAILAAGQWRPTAEPADPGFRSYHINSLYSPLGWYPWAKMARDFLDAKASGPQRMRAFVNLRLAETWAEAGEAPEWQRLAERREPFPMEMVPPGALVLTAGIDCQRDRLECHVWAWAEGFERWHVAVRVIPYAPSDPRAWEGVREILEHPFPRADGGTLTISRAAIDSGDMTQDVYAGVRSLATDRAIAVKGDDGEAAIQPVRPPQDVDLKRSGVRLRRALKLWRVVSGHFKRELYLRLAMTVREDGTRPPGWVHLSHELDPEHVKQLVAERRQLARKTRKPEWVKTRDRNEALDCAVYARAALYTLGADAKGSAFWRRLRGLRELELATMQDETPEPPAAAAGAAEAAAIGEDDTPPPPPPPPPPAAPKAARRGGWLGERRGWLR